MSETIPEFCIDRTSQLKESTLFAVRAGNREGQEENAEPVNVVR